MFLICSASRIWSFCLSFWCSNIVVLLVRIFRSCVVGHECFFKCWAIELVSESYITFVIDPPLMTAQSWAESTRDTYNYGQYINQFPPNMIKVIREFERIQKKICRHKMSIMFNEICIYIFTNLISTSIHGTRKKKKKKTLPGTRDKSISNHCPGEKEKIIGQKERKGQPCPTPWKKIKGYAVGWSKEN